MIDFLGGQLLVWGIGIPVVLISLWLIWTPRRRSRYIIRSGDIIQAIERRDVLRDDHTDERPRQQPICPDRRRK